MRKLIPVAVLGLLAVSCGDSGPTSAACTGEGRELWDCRGITDYRLTLTHHCFCFAGGQPIEVEVRGGEPVLARFVETGEVIPREHGLHTTVEDLFRAVADADPVTFQVVVEYDADLGYPSSIEVRCREQIPDCDRTIVAEVVPRRIRLPL